MADLRSFDANKIAPAIPYELMPDGKYPAFIFSSEMKNTKSGMGQYLELTLQISEGPFFGRRLTARLNLTNPNPEAERIAQAQLSAICHAVGVTNPQDSSDLHESELWIHVQRKKRQDTGGIDNEITGYSKMEKPGAANVPADNTSP